MSPFLLCALRPVSRSVNMSPPIALSLSSMRTTIVVAVKANTNHTLLKQNTFLNINIFSTTINYKHSFCQKPTSLLQIPEIGKTHGPSPGLFSLHTFLNRKHLTPTAKYVCCLSSSHFRFFFLVCYVCCYFVCLSCVNI